MGEAYDGQVFGEKAVTVVHVGQQMEGIVDNCFDYELGRTGFGRVGIDCVGSTGAVDEP